MCCPLVISMWYYFAFFFTKVDRIDTGTVGSLTNAAFSGKQRLDKKVAQKGVDVLQRRWRRGLANLVNTI